MNLNKEVRIATGCGDKNAKDRIKYVCVRLGIDGLKDATEEQRGIIKEHAIANTLPAMPAVPVVAVTAKSSFDEIRDSGYLHLNDAEANAIAFAHDIAALKEKCSSVSGGSDFTKLAKQYWELSSSQASRLLKIGLNTSFPKFGKATPKTVSALEPLAALSHDELEAAVESGKVHPKMTAKEAKAVVKKVKPKTTAQVVERITDKARLGEIEDAEIVPPADGEEFYIVDGEAVEVKAHEYTSDEIAGMVDESNNTIRNIVDELADLEEQINATPEIYGALGKDYLKAISRIYEAMDSKGFEFDSGFDVDLT